VHADSLEYVLGSQVASVGSRNDFWDSERLVAVAKAGLSRFRGIALSPVLLCKSKPEVDFESVFGAAQSAPTQFGSIIMPNHEPAPKTVELVLRVVLDKGLGVLNRIERSIAGVLKHLGIQVELVQEPCILRGPLPQK
jgi:hypothetical protein